MNEDFYKILGVSKTASADEIKAAYRKLAHKYHPDKSGGDEKKFKEINEAYQVLSNAEKRAQYDRFGKNPGQGFGGFGGFDMGGGQGGFQNGGQYGGEWNFGGGEMGDIQDILESIFGMGGGSAGGRQARRRTYKRGGDLEMKVDITLEEAKSGKKIESKFETLVECGICQGVGYDPKAGMDECPQCNGRGEIKEERRSFFGNFSQVVACKKCNGVGKIPKKQCAHCKGAGRVAGTRNVVIDARPGVEDEQIIKIKGVGEAGEHAMEAGDLYVRIHVKPNPNFERKGNDIYMNVPVRVTDALLGLRKEIKNLGGKPIHFEIPAGFDLRQEFHVKGEGMTQAGDLILRFDVRTPKSLSPKARKLLEDLEGEL